MVGHRRIAAEMRPSETPPPARAFAWHHAAIRVTSLNATTPGAILKSLLVGIAPTQPSRGPVVRPCVKSGNPCRRRSRYLPWRHRNLFRSSHASGSQYCSASSIEQRDAGSPSGLPASCRAFVFALCAADVRHEEWWWKSAPVRKNCGPVVFRTPRSVRSPSACGPQRPEASLTGNIVPCRGEVFPLLYGRRTPCSQQA